MERDELAEEVVTMALAAGASAAEVMVREGSEFSSSVRLGSVEKLLQASFRKLGMRIFNGRRTAISATSDFSLDALRQVAAETLDMARAAHEDPDAGLPPEEDYARTRPEMTLSFPRAQELDPGQKISLARRCEEAALKFDSRINNSEGAVFSDSITRLSYANSLGIRGAYSKTVSSLFATPLAERNGRKQRDYWLSRQLDLSSLQTPEEIGREAAQRTLRRLGAQKVRTCEAPVVFDPRAGTSLLSHFTDAVSGTVLRRKASFLMGKLGERIASAIVSIYDDACMPSGLGSRPFDSEGVPSQGTPVVEEGILTAYLLDSYSARKLGLHSTGNSARELSGAPLVGPSNFYLKPGKQNPEEIIESVKDGLYVTELIGSGVNIVTGDFSQGAVGIWIENGELAYPVEEITIAGNLRDMLTGIEAIGNDLLPVNEVFSPTFKISKMVVSGN